MIIIVGNHYLINSLVEPVRPDSRLPGVKPFSKFDGRQLCSPLTYRPHISIIKRSKPVIRCAILSRGWHYFKGRFCPVKVTSHFNSVSLLRVPFSSVIAEFMYLPQFKLYTCIFLPVIFLVFKIFFPFFLIGCIVSVTDT